MQNAPHFSRQNDLDFVTELRRNVNQYFKKHNISKFANMTMYIKTAVLMLLYLTPYFLLISSLVSNITVMYLLFAIMGVAMAGIGFSIMHDANHGAYSQSRKVNSFFGKFVYLIGGCATTWKIQHNVLHHTYTNVEGHDEDIDPGVFMCLSPHAKRYALHKYQHIYGWLIYGMMTFLWLTTKDFNQLVRYKKLGLLKHTNQQLAWSLLKLTIAKLVYYTVFLALPVFVLPFTWWQVLLGFLLMHYVAGMILGAVFQPAHVVPEVEYPLPDKDSKTFENAWAVHQLHTTTNFAKKNKYLTWFVGGLNFQVEHHLFPNICHVHYPKIAKIVEETAKKYGHPYHYTKSYRSALYNHANMLKQLGNGIVKQTKMA